MVLVQPNSYGVVAHNYLAGVAMGAWAYTGDLYRGYSGDWPGGTLKFYVTNAGNVYCDGTYNTFKSAQSKSGENHVTLKGTQSPEAWIEDFGHGELINGQSIVNIDETYIQVASTSDDYLVYLTPVSDKPVQLYVFKKASDAFTVKGVYLDGNPAECTFDYRIVAKDSDSRGERFEGVNIPDPIVVPRTR